MKATNPIPKTSKGWLDEIAAAYRDAQETLPFGDLVGQPMSEEDLFHLGPAVCLKVRGVKSSKSTLKRATDTALSSYVATKDIVGNLFDVPQMSFAFCYVASHLGLGFVNEEDSYEILDYIEQNLETLVELIGTE